MKWIVPVENMREAELRTAIAEWKSKYEEVYNEVLKLRKTIEDDIKEQTELAAKRAVDSQMEALIYQQLY